MVCEGLTLADIESEWWSPDTHFRRKLVRISVTPEGVCTRGRKLSTSVGLTPELCSGLPNCMARLTTEVHLYFLFHIGVPAVLHDREVQAKVMGAANGL